MNRSSRNVELSILRGFTITKEVHNTMHKITGAYSLTEANQLYQYVATCTGTSPLMFFKHIFEGGGRKRVIGIRFHSRTLTNSLHRLIHIKAESTEPTYIRIKYSPILQVRDLFRGWGSAGISHPSLIDRSLLPRISKMYRRVLKMLKCVCPIFVYPFDEPAIE